MKVTFIGSGGNIVTADRSCPSILVDEELLLDCGFGSLKNLRAANVSLKDLRSLLLTHHHADHVGDLVALLWAMAMEGRDVPFEIWGPNGTDKLTVSLLKSMHTPPEYVMLKLKFKNLAGRETIGNIKVLRAIHKPINLAYKIEKNGISLCYSGDTAYCEQLISLASGCNLLIHDSAFLDEQKEIATLTNHSTASEAGKIAEAAGVKKLVLFHILPFNRVFEAELLRQAKREFNGEILIVKDLEVLEI